MNSNESSETDSPIVFQENGSRRSGMRKGAGTELLTAGRGCNEGEKRKYGGLTCSNTRGEGEGAGPVRSGKSPAKGHGFRQL